MRKSSSPSTSRTFLFCNTFILFILIICKSICAEIPSNPELWLRADRGLKTNSTGQIIEWNDQSGTDNVARPVNTASAPHLLKADIKGYPVVVFDGKNDMLKLEKEMLISPDFTAFFVVFNTFQKPADSVSRPVLSGIDAFNKNGKSYAFSYTGESHIFRISNGSENNFADLKLITHNQYDVITINADHQKLQCYNFEEKFKPVELPAKVFSAKQKYFIGGGVPNTANYKGKIAEIIIYNRQLKPAEQEKVQKYLLEKYFSGSEAPKRDLSLLKKINFDNMPLKVMQVDVLDRVFPDRIPENRKYSGPSGTPKNAAVFFQFALIAQNDLQCKLDLPVLMDTKGTRFPGSLHLYEAKPVRVEGNTQGHEWCVPDGKVPEGWMKFLVRKAPFYINEALWPAKEINMKKGTFYSLVVEARVPQNTKAGIYRGKLEIKASDKTITAPFSFKVYKTSLDSRYTLDSTHWLSVQPSELSSGKTPEWWSPQHWELIRRNGEILLHYGDNTMFTYLTERRWYGDNQPLVKVMRNPDGTFSFDFSRFEKWADMFYTMGYKYISGSHVVRTRYWTYVYDLKSKKYQRLVDCFEGTEAEKQEQWLDKFMKPYTKELYGIIKKNGWTKKYIQNVYDEPKDADLYKKLSDIVRTNMPGIPTADANNSHPQQYSPLMDILVFNLVNILRNKELVEQRIKNGKTTWLYHCVSPYPPFPNRHLDSFLTESRLWPWLCFDTKATGFLYWAANTYQGQNEYESSLGPKGKQKYGTKVYMGYEPGDNWFLYRTPDGLVPSMRLIAHKAGTIDYALLKMAQKKDPAFVNQILGEIVNGIVKKVRKAPKDLRWFMLSDHKYLQKTYTVKPEDYHIARNKILQKLEQK